MFFKIVKNTFSNKKFIFNQLLRNLKIFEKLYDSPMKIYIFSLHFV